MSETATDRPGAAMFQGAQSGSYHGVDTPLAFTGAAAELQALLTSFGVFDLGWRTKTAVTGKDRVRWLNGMITNNIRDLAVNRGNYSFALNHQGRIIADLYTYNFGDHFVIDSDHSLSETILKTLGRYIIMDDVKLADSGQTLAALGVCGPKAKDALSALVNIAESGPLQVTQEKLGALEITVVRGPEQKPDWYEIWTHPENIQAVWKILTRTGAQPVGANALEFWRVLRGIPQYGQDIRERDLPQETEQSQALNFTKGCYIGQEIVERIRSRGQVHRKFSGFEFTDGLIAPGKYEAEGRTLAEITTSLEIPLPGGTKNFGLGYVRRESVTPGSQIDLNGKKATVVDLPFAISSN
jgi:folate-binding protein YgfZ